MKYVSVYDITDALNEYLGDVKKYLKVCAPKQIAKTRIATASANGWTNLGYEIEGMIAHLKVSVSTFDDRQETTLRLLARPSWKDMKVGTR